MAGVFGTKLDPSVPHFFVGRPDYMEEKGQKKCQRCGHTMRHRIHLRPPADAGKQEEKRAATG
jgi:hypothetical protein